MKVSRPTVSVALKALAEEGSIFVDDAYEVHLTIKGRRITETYFGAYLPQFFNAMLAPFTLFVYLSFVSMPCRYEQNSYKKS